MNAILTGLAAVSPVGDDGPSTFAALRASVAGLAEHPWLALSPPDPEWDAPEPLRAGVVASIDGELAGPARLIALARGALQALVRDARLSRDELTSCTFFLALPEEGPDVAPWELGRRFAPELFGAAGLAPPRRIEIDQSGHTGAMVSLFSAIRCLGERTAERCVVLAVDSYLDEQRIADWDGRRRRLRSDRSRDGFLPGEAAVALLLEAPRPAPAGGGLHGLEGGGRAPLATLSVPTFGQEPQAIEGELAPTGKGLTDAVRRAFTAVHGSVRPSVVYADHNGESHRAFEWGLLRARLAPRLDGCPLRHPADCIGDVGAASGALLLGLAAHALGRDAQLGAGPPPGPALVLTSATSGHRAAAIVSEGPCPPP